MSLEVCSEAEGARTQPEPTQLEPTRMEPAAIAATQLDSPEPSQTASPRVRLPGISEAGKKT